MRENSNFSNIYLVSFLARKIKCMIWQIFIKSRIFVDFLSKNRTFFFVCTLRSFKEKYVVSCLHYLPDWFPENLQDH